MSSVPLSVGFSEAVLDLGLREPGNNLRQVDFSKKEQMLLLQKCRALWRKVGGIQQQQEVDPSRVLQGKFLQVSKVRAHQSNYALPGREEYQEPYD